jgi:hypothetical protein
MHQFYAQNKQDKVTAELTGTCVYGKYHTYSMWRTKHLLAVTHLLHSCAVKLPQRRRELSNSSVSKCASKVDNKKIYYFKQRWQFILTTYCDGSCGCHTNRNRRMKCKHTEKITQYFVLIKGSSALKTNFTSYRQDALIEIPLQFAICKELTFKLQYKH